MRCYIVKYCSGNCSVGRTVGDAVAFSSLDEDTTVSVSSPLKIVPEIVPVTYIT